jgi:hypothetical protein
VLANLLWVVCEVTMSALGSSVRQNSEDASAAKCFIRSTDVGLNTRTSKTWQQASDACAALQSKAKAGSIWGRVSKFETGDAGSAEFELRCQKCGTQCQLANPAKWHKDHTEEAYVKRARKAPNFKRQAVTSSINVQPAPHRPKVHPYTTIQLLKTTDASVLYCIQISVLHEGEGDARCSHGLAQPINECFLLLGIRCELSNIAHVECLI